MGWDGCLLDPYPEMGVKNEGLSRRRNKTWSCSKLDAAGENPDLGLLKLEMQEPFLDYFSPFLEGRALCHPPLSPVHVQRC